MSLKLSRRELLKIMGTLALATPLLQACGGKPTEAPSEEEQPVEQPSTEETIELSVTVWTDAVRTFQEEKSKEWAEQHPNVNLKIEAIPYGDMAKHQLTGLATGTLQDVVFSGVKWMHYSAFKGAFLALDELVQAEDPGMDDFIPAAIEGCTLDGKLYGLPFETNTGNTNIIYYNKDLLAEKGVEEPTDDWTVNEFVEKALAANDPDNRIFGTNIFCSNYYDLACWIRSWGSDIFDEERKKFNLADDPKAKAAAKWLTELRTKHHVAPLRDEAEGLDFNAGQMAFRGWGSYGVGYTRDAVGDKFEWDAVLAPKGPDGLRGYEIFVTLYSIYSKTKHPKEAYSLLTYLTSKETAMYAFVNQGQPPARLSVMNSPEAAKMHPIWARIAAWLSDGVNKGPFPMPWNLRFSELQDTFANYAADVWYGDVDFEEGIQKIQEECQKIMDQPRG